MYVQKTIILTLESSYRNLNTSCTLAPAELDCYQQALDSDPEYQLLTGGFNKALRSCIQKYRLKIISFS